eukprot:1569763-Pyramimonas_sp.AAC.1
MQRNTDSESPFMKKLWDTGGLMQAWAHKDDVLRQDDKEKRESADQSEAPSDTPKVPSPEVKNK